MRNASPPEISPGAYLLRARGGSLERRTIFFVTDLGLLVKRSPTQTLVSDYEQDRRRLHAEMIVKVAKILGVSTDELLGSRPMRSAANGPLSLKLTRRLHRIEELSPARQKLVLQTLDTILKGPASS